MRVVAAAIVRGGRVLAARRVRPERLAGGWEFPGGKIEAGEDDRTALTRECEEELGVHVAVGDRLGSAEGGELRLVLYAACIVDGEPTTGADHDAIRWLSDNELDVIEWLPIDRDLLPAVRGLLTRAR